MSGWKNVNGEEVMKMEQAVIEILQAVGVYGSARERVGSDKDLVEMFCDQFEDLVSIMEQPPRIRVRGGRKTKEVNI